MRKITPLQQLVAGQILMREAELLHGKAGEVSEANRAPSREKYQAAVKTLRLAESRAASGSEAMRQAMYSIGVCFMEAGDDRAANDQFTRTHKLYPETPEGAAACLQMAELSRRARPRHGNALRVSPRARGKRQADRVPQSVARARRR